MELFLGSGESDLVPWGRDLDPEYPRGERGVVVQIPPAPSKRRVSPSGSSCCLSCQVPPGMHSKHISPQAGGFSPLLGVPAMAVTQT